MALSALLGLLGAIQDGSHLPLSGKDLSSSGRDDRLVFAYFYARDDATVRHDLHEMSKSGIDVALVIGADPARLSALGRALEDLDREIRVHPRVAPAIDVAPLKGVDLTTEDGRMRLYALISGFYSQMPPKSWSVVDGRPLVWLLPAPVGTRVEKRLGEDLSKIGRRDFDGRSFYLATDVSWRDVPADRRFAWGAAHDGPRDLPIVSVGPGCASPDRPRDDGKFYERGWYVALRLEPRWVAIESWNGGAEGTDVAESKEQKRKYVEATLQYARKFKLGEQIPLPKGKWTGSAKALYTAKYSPHEQGLRPVAAEAGAFEFIQLRGIAMLASKENPSLTRRSIGFDVDDSFSLLERRAFEVTVEFLDSGEGTFSLEYDSWDPKLGVPERAAKSAGERAFTATGDWRTETFDLPDARFGNSQSGGADFRLVTEKRGIAVRRVAVIPK
jgi:hypothetical protein